MMGMRAFSNATDLFFALGVIGLVCIFVIPLPPFLLDTCLVLSILLSVMTLLITLYIQEPLEFSVFPSLLLFLTLYRLALNIASTRMILTQQVAGKIIYTFGEFVTSSSSMVGIILYLLLTVINFVLVSKGAGRIAEVAARFNLEALSGKQMAIESERSFSQAEAQKMREKISAESDFYGAMDGASKFVRGDAICSCIITVVNLFGGFIVGVVVKGLSIAECWQTMSRLTIGDGLVNQIPALFISVGAAMMVTRVSRARLGTLLSVQLFSHPKVILVTAIFSLILCTIPGMPLLVLLPIAFLLFWYARHLFRIEKPQSGTKIESVDQEIIYPLSIELSRELLPCADLIQKRIPLLRQHIVTTLGVKLPGVHITDNLELSEKQYLIKLREVPIFYGIGENTNDILEQLQKSVKKHLFSLVTRQDVAMMVERAKKEDSAVVQELIPSKLKLGQLLKVLQNLLKEQVSIRDFITILEAIADHLSEDKPFDIALLTEKVRQSLVHTISQSFIGKDKIAYAITLDAKVQQMIKHATGMTPLRAATITKMNHEMLRLVDEAKERSLSPVIMTAAFARASVKQLIESHLPDLPVLAFEELSSDVKIENVGRITNDILI